MGNEYQRFLMHHDIKGQKWGERNGPPYPLKPSQRSAAEKKAGGGTQGSPAAVVLSTAAITAATVAIVSSMKEKFESNRRKKENEQWHREKEEMLNEAEKNSNDKRYASERENEEIDPETGLYLTGKKMTAEENMERINPSFDTGNEMFKLNDVACTTAMELRERGYDVHAGTDGMEMYLNDGVKTSDLESTWYSGKNPYKHTKEYTPYYDGDKAIKTFKSDISKETNSRGDITYNWLCGPKHSVYYKVDNTGKLTLYDSQSNHKLTDAEADDIIETVAQIKYTRLDNSTPNIQYLKDNNYIC